MFAAEKSNMEITLPTNLERRRLGMRAAVNHGIIVGFLLLVGSFALAASAVAENDGAFVDAVSAARTGSSCGPLNRNATLDRAADVVNRSTFRFLNHTAESNPPDPEQSAAIIKELGFDGPHVVILQGAGSEESAAIKGVLLDGRDALLDCSYTKFGVSHLYESESGFYILVAILGGG